LPFLGQEEEKAGMCNVSWSQWGSDNGICWRCRGSCLAGALVSVHLESSSKMVL
jgi:hypothetical protein